MSKLLQINEVADAVGRVPHTVRQWERSGMLPPHLLPSRDHRGWRWWTEAQVEGIKDWIISADIRPGKAFRKKEKP